MKCCGINSIQIGFDCVWRFQSNNWNTHPLQHCILALFWRIHTDWIVKYRISICRFQVICPCIDFCHVDILNQNVWYEGDGDEKKEKKKWIPVLHWWRGANIPCICFYSMLKDTCQKHPHACFNLMIHTHNVVHPTT